jgi:predicted TIM-barrel fold metal-dependent hydrolase
VKCPASSVISTPSLHKQTTTETLPSSDITSHHIMVPPLITLEEHFVSVVGLGDNAAAKMFPEAVVARLQDLGEARLRDMDAGKTALQVISHAPLDASPADCRRANDQLAAACAAHPTRFAGFATLPMGEPDAAAQELKRMVRDHGFLGALIDNQLEDGQMYDASKFWPVFETAEALDVPIYIHPTYPGSDLADHYKGNFPDTTAFMLGTFSWGWHAETGLHILRLFAAGLFDKFPKLKIVIGHMGEFLPYMFERFVKSSHLWGERERDLRTVWEENLWITTSGHFALPPFECLVKTFPRDKVLYSVDYPFSMPERGLQFVEEVEKAGILTAEELEGFCYRNAERLLKAKLSI